MLDEVTLVGKFVQVNIEDSLGSRCVTDCLVGIMRHIFGNLQAYERKVRKNLPENLICVYTVLLIAFYPSPSFIMKVSSLNWPSRAHIVPYVLQNSEGRMLTLFER